MGVYRSKKIGLPGGREIEIVFFSDADDEQAGAAWEPGGDDLSAGDATALVSPWGEPREDLHVCPDCDGDLVHPVRWDASDDDDLWTIERRCPNCGWQTVGRVTQEEAEIFDDTLNEGTEELLCVLRRMARLNMQADAARFIDALQQDLIVPMDF